VLTNPKSHTDLQGPHLRLPSNAVSCIDADQERLGEVKRSKVSSFRVMRPFPAFANSTSRCAGVAPSTEEKAARVASPANKMLFIVS